jgi:hypothetical protein
MTDQIVFNNWEVVFYESVRFSIRTEEKEAGDPDEGSR